MSFRWFSLIGLASLSACQKAHEIAVEVEALPPISYHAEVLPILAANCLSCHSPAKLTEGYRLNLTAPSIPETFNPENHHELKLTAEKNQLLTRWLKEGQNIDLPWADRPLPQELTEEPLSALTSEKSAWQEPKIDLPSPARVTQLITGDAYDEALATRFLRQGDDTPEARLALVSRRFLGTDLDCARCHDHPTASFSTTDYQTLRQAFTHPYDGQDHPLRPPLLTRESASIVPFDQEPSDQDLEDYRKFHFPPGEIPDLITAFSFNGGRATNLSLTARGTQRSVVPSTAGIQRQALKLGSEPVALTTRAALTGICSFTLSFWFQTDQEDTTILETDGFSLSVNQEQLHARLFRYWPGNGIGIRSRARLSGLQHWNHIAASYDGSRTAAGFRLYVNGKMLETHETGSALQGLIPNSTIVHLGGPKSSGAVDELMIHQRALQKEEIAHLAGGLSLPEKISPDWFFEAFHGPTRASRETHRQRLAGIAIEDFPVMESLPGNTGRLAFAQRLNENPARLARALANDFWRQIFGQVLIPEFTIPDPEHARLIDQLAARLVRDNWNPNALVELIRETNVRPPKVKRPICPRPILIRPKRIEENQSLNSAN